MKRHATAHWSGNLADGKGSLTTQSGALTDHAYSFKARFEDESGTSGTNPEELLAAAHAGCFTMQLSHLLAENGTPAADLDTGLVRCERGLCRRARVRLQLCQSFQSDGSECGVGGLSKPVQPVV